MARYARHVPTPANTKYFPGFGDALASVTPGTTLVLALFLLVGCGEPEPSGPDVFPAKGTVRTPSGKPLSGGSIYFRSVDAPTFEAIGEIAEDGTFTLYTMVQGNRLDGAIPGEHRVTVIPAGSANEVPAAIELSGTYQIGPQGNELELQLPP